MVQIVMHCLSLRTTLFTNKVTSTSIDGIETVSVNLQGDARAKTDGWYPTPVVGGVILVM